MQASPDLLDLQRGVQRKLGRNLLRLQQYERGLKTLIAASEICGAADELQAKQAQRRDKFANKTLGQLVGNLTGDFLSSGSEGDAAECKESEEVLKALERKQEYVQMQMKINISVEEHDQIRQDLAQLVGMRNELVHHFLERFDLQDAESCQKADAYLDGCLSQIDAQWQMLRELAEAHDAAHQQMVALMETPEWIDSFLHGIEPDGQIIWPRATIVEALRHAEAALTRNGWTALADAIVHIHQSYPDHTPKRYGCKTWRQVIRESKLFEMRREVAAETGAGVVWYRSQPRYT